MPRPSDPHARQRLLDAARAVFSERGLDRAKVEDITSLAQLSKGAFYLHFDSKEEAFRELVEELMLHLERLVDNTTAEQLATAPASLSTLFDYIDACHQRNLEIFEFVWDHRALMALVLDGGGSATYQHLIEDFALRAQRQTMQLLAHGIEIGLYRRDLDLEAAAAFIAGGFDRIARQLVRRTVKPDLDALLREVQRQLLGGVARPEVLSAIAPPITKISGPKTTERADFDSARGTAG
jgi:AcrR family transcriptional regulator